MSIIEVPVKKNVKELIIVTTCNITAHNEKHQFKVFFEMYPFLSLNLEQNVHAFYVSTELL